MTNLTKNRDNQRPDGVRACEWPGCPGDGEFKAPRSREALNDYRWFCLDHVREYNRNWNYYRGMNEDEVEEDVRRDTTWHRPTWKLGSGDSFKAAQAKFWDPLGVADAARDADARAQGVTQTPAPDAKTSRALAVFDLEVPISAETVKSRYKELVKRHHPDANGGTKAAEEKFKQVTEAYETIVAFLNP
ncbi:MAG: DnaJ domain-containing protein [Rhodospirillaceae bacterium]